MRSSRHSPEWFNVTMDIISAAPVITKEQRSLYKIPPTIDVIGMQICPLRCGGRYMGRADGFEKFLKSLQQGEAGIEEIEYTNNIPGCSVMACIVNEGKRKTLNCVRVVVRSYRKG